MTLDDFKLYLPKYLSPGSEDTLFQCLKDFPANIDSRLYTSYLKKDKTVFQGDGIDEMPVVNLPDSDMREVPVIILSNTCDIDPSNLRNFPSQIVYAPIVNLQKYQNNLIKYSSKSEESITQHIDLIRKQGITQIFYLPKIGDKLNESIVFLDRLNNINNKYVSNMDILSKRIFTLSNYGAYLFLLKISIHFTRFNDGVDRNGA